MLAHGNPVLCSQQGDGRDDQTQPSPSSALLSQSLQEILGDEHKQNQRVNTQQRSHPPATLASSCKGRRAPAPPYLCPAEVLVGQVVMHHALVLVLQDTAWERPGERGSELRNS